MFHPVEVLERGSIITFGLSYHGEPFPVRPEYPDILGYHSVDCQNVETPVPVQGVVQLMEFQEDLIDNLLLHCRQILEQLGFKGVSPCPLA